MKHVFSKAILFCLFLVTSLVAKAQEVKKYTQSMDSLLTYIDIKQAKTGIFYDRVYPFANLKEQTKDSNQEHFIQSWSELYRASYNPTFKHIEQIKVEIKKSYSDLNAVPIGFINTSFDYFKDSLETVEGYFRTKPNQDLFLHKDITLISPLKKSVWTKDKVIYSFSSDFVLNQNGKKIKEVKADFGTGKIYPFFENGKAINQTIEVVYNEAGNKEISFVITFEDQTVQKQTATIQVRLAPTNSTQRLTSSAPEKDFVGDSGITVTIPFKGYNETYPRSGTLEYRVYFNENNNDTILRKPIIILDGFDPGDTRKIYTGSDNYNEDYPSLYELMIFKNSDSLPDNIVELLRSKEYGYDVILVNFQEVQIILSAMQWQ